LYGEEAKLASEVKEKDEVITKLQSEIDHLRIMANNAIASEKKLSTSMMVCMANLLHHM
jgi:hypothetical protein